MNSTRTLTPRARRAAVLALLAALLMGLATKCQSEGGYYQGGGDSSPSWRK